MALRPVDGQLAGELKFSETAFVVPLGQEFELRWFTPTTEVDLCGHATLAAAAVLWEERMASRTQPIVFHTASGLLTCEIRGSWIEMDFPAEPPREVRAPGMLRVSLGVDPVWTGRNRMDWLVELADEATVRALTPNLDLLRRLGGRGVIVTAPAAAGREDGVEVVSRFFAPAAGIDEDPVTGSAHCALGPYWSRRLKKREFLAEQLSKRGGVVRVTHKEVRVVLGGYATIVSRGDLLIAPTRPEDDLAQARDVDEGVVALPDVNFPTHPWRGSGI